MRIAVAKSFISIAIFTLICKGAFGFVTMHGANVRIEGNCSNDLFSSVEKLVEREGYVRNQATLQNAVGSIEKSENVDWNRRAWKFVDIPAIHLWITGRKSSGVVEVSMSEIRSLFDKKFSAKTQAKYDDLLHSFRVNLQGCNIIESPPKS